MGHKQKRNRRIPSKGKQLPSYNQIHGRNIRNRNYILGQRFNKDSILDVRTHFKSNGDIPIHKFLFCHPPGVTKGFIKGEALKLLRTNSSEITSILKNRDCPATTVEKHVSEVIFADRKKALEHRNKNARKKILPFHALCNAIPPCVAQP